MSAAMLKLTPHAAPGERQRTAYVRADSIHAVRESEKGGGVDLMLSSGFVLQFVEPIDTVIELMGSARRVPVGQ